LNFNIVISTALTYGYALLMIRTQSLKLTVLRLHPVTRP
jgi:hypothetical protein